MGGGGGGLTFTWYTYRPTSTCVSAFGVLFHEIWYRDRWVFIREEGAQIQKLGIEQIIVKSTLLGKLGAFLYRKR